MPPYIPEFEHFYLSYKYDSVKKIYICLEVLLQRYPKFRPLLQEVNKSFIQFGVLKDKLFFDKTINKYLGFNC